jgi:hypothetical protein
MAIRAWDQDAAVERIALAELGGLLQRITRLDTTCARTGRSARGAWAHWQGWA